MLTISKSQFPITGLTGYRGKSSKRFADREQPKLAEANSGRSEFIDAEFEELLEGGAAANDDGNVYQSIQFPKFQFKRVYVDYYA